MGGRSDAVVENSRFDTNVILDGDAATMRAISSIFIDVVRPFSISMARLIHDEVPELRGLGDDEEALEQTRVSCEVNMREMFSMLRAGLPVTAHVTPVEALEYVRFMRSRGIGLTPVIAAYKYGVAMFRDVLGPELQARIDDPQRLQALAQGADEFVFRYIHRVTERLGAEYGLERGWSPSAEDAIFSDQTCLDTAARFKEEQVARGEWLAASVEESRARSEAEAMLDAFAGMIEHGAQDPAIAQRMCLANTSVEVILADEPDLSINLQLKKPPVEVTDGGGNAETQMSIASVDLGRLWSQDFHLPLAIAKGRIRVSGPVRKFLRITPIIRELAAMQRRAANPGSTQPSQLRPDELD